MNRRQFVSTLGMATAIAPRGSSAAQVGSGVPDRARISLNGQWERFVNGVPVDRVPVPASLRPSGYYRLKRDLVLPRLTGHNRVFLHFEAINSHGRVFANAAELGTTAPYVPHEFEMTAHAREGVNHIEVAVADLCSEPDGSGADEVWLGVNPGWEGYGGIIRDAWAEIRPGIFIENVRLGYQLRSDHTQAACRVAAFLSARAATEATIEVWLARGRAQIANPKKPVRLAAGTTVVELEFTVPEPALWSPDQPNLYDLAVTLQTPDGSDRFTQRTGLRETTIRGRAFELNGEPILLHGVCRHDLWKDQGFTLTRPQMEQDMRAIKALGANFVRLVHYPHDRRIIELADELGLLVTEEPGFWGMDFRNMPWSRAELGLNLLERVVRRDWNSPSVFAWLLGNESKFTVEYLRQGKAMCRSLDPLARFVGIANDLPKELAKPLIEESGLDFFDHHPYTFDVEQFQTIVEFYGADKPVLFTEWGGKEIGQGQAIMPKTVDKLLDLTDNKLLAGHAFWSWQDLPQFSRIDPEMRDGILESGAVTEGREPRPLVFSELSRLFQGRRHVELPGAEAPEPVSLRRSAWASVARVEPLDMAADATSERGVKSWADFESRMATHWEELGASSHWKRTGQRFLLWKNRPLAILGAPFLAPSVEGFVRPQVLTPAYPEFEIAVGGHASAIHFLGHVTCPDKNPIARGAGETVATYEIRYRGGRTRSVPLRAGYEVAAANAIHGSGRIDPIATVAQRAFWFIKDRGREQYQVLLYSVPVENEELAGITCRLRKGQPPLLLFAISVERA